MGKIKVSMSATLIFLAAALTGRVDIFLIYGLSAIMHEMGHLLAARARGIKIQEIRIGVSGARICTEEQAGSYADEFILCMSGPLVNVLMLAFGAAVLVYRNIGEESIARAIIDFADGKGQVRLGAFIFFMLCSLLHGGLNLLPIKTFDGGRMLYCISAMVFGQRTAERVLSVTTALCMLLIWSAALFLMIRFDAGLSIYTFAACLFLSTLRDKELIE